MKKFRLIVLTGDRLEHFTVFAESFSTQTNSGTSSGYYAFYADRNLVCCYPISRTIISSIDEVEE